MEHLPVSTLWAMHPRALEALVVRQARRAVLPEAIAAVAKAFAGGPAQAAASPSREGHALIVPVAGILAPRGMSSGGTSYDFIADAVREGAADRQVATIVLDVRSVGGTVWGCDEAADAIYQARAVKPVVAVASLCCFSAAHWLATQAGSFFCTPSGEVGSVGVRSGHTDMSGFERKIGMVTTLVASSPDKIAGHPYGPLSDDDRAEIQSGVDEASGRFNAAIARGRRIPVAQVVRVHGSGKSFSAGAAHRRGAIDGVRTLREVVGQTASGRTRLALMRRQAAAMALAVSI